MNKYDFQNLMNQARILKVKPKKFKISRPWFKKKKKKTPKVGKGLLVLVCATGPFVNMKLAHILTVHHSSQSHGFSIS